MKSCFVIPKNKIQGHLRESLIENGSLFYDYDENEEECNLFLTEIRKNGLFIKRNFAETDENFLQIIPSFYIHCPGEILFYSRKSTHTEQRLANKWTCLFGGHIDEIDKEKGMLKIDLLNTEIQLPSIITRCLEREMKEETGIDIKDITLAIKGFIFDNRDPVGRVHLGIIFEVSKRNFDLEIEKIKGLPEIGEVACVTLEVAHSRDLPGIFEGWAEIAIEKII